MVHETMLNEIQPKGAGRRGTSSLFSGALACLALLSPGIAAASPELSVSEVTVPGTVAPGTNFTVGWSIQNKGSEGASGVFYVVVLSSDDGISVTDRELGSGTVDAPMSSMPSEQLVQLAMPADVPEGSYHVGVIVDPHHELGEQDTRDNAAASRSFTVAAASLTILTSSLPPTELGAPFCARLDAAGGDGVYTWSVADGSRLPPGFSLLTLPEAAEQPLATSLCGRAAALGAYSFTLEVSSAGLREQRPLELEVRSGELPLVVPSQLLPTGLFRRAYQASMVATGGTAPYTWSVVLGKLPRGLHLRSDGVIQGIAEADGRFPLTLRVTDSAGTTADRALELFVSSPLRLSCVTGALPRQEVGEAYTETLLASGGERPYRWRSVETRRLGAALGEQPALLGEKPPPGLILDASTGKVSGAPTKMGHYVWTVEVTDAQQEIQSCTVTVEVLDDHRLVIATSSLSAAIAGQSYRARLDASGASGQVNWSLLSGSRLPSGLSIDMTGLIEGSPGIDQLEGDDRRDFSFVVVARDEENRLAIAPITLPLLAKAPAIVADPSRSAEDGGGCSAAGSEPALLALSLGIWGLLRRRTE